MLPTSISASSIIGLVGNLRSTLARNADAVLDAGVDKEACPFNLAPTTTSCCLVNWGRSGNDINASQLKILRSTIAGRLGKRLTLRLEI